jgi:hypothetical protein
MLEASLSNPLCTLGRNSDLTNCDDETDDDLPSIEELWDRISRKGISIRGYRNPEDTLQDLEDPILDTSRSRLNLIHSKFDDSVGDDQGTRGMRDGSPSL